jgi:hypothetical protein
MEMLQPMDSVKKISLVGLACLISFVLFSLSTVALGFIIDYFEKNNMLEARLISDNFMKLILLVFVGLCLWISGKLLKVDKYKRWGRKALYIYCAGSIIPYLLSFLIEPDSNQLTKNLIDKAVHVVNSKAPFVIDKNTRLDSAVAHSDYVSYNYTLLALKKENIPSEFIKTEFVPAMKSSVCGVPALKNLLDNQINLSYVYNDQDGKHVIQFKIKPSDCVAISS